MFLAGSLSEVTLSDGTKAHYSSQWSRLNQRNMDDFALPLECVNKDCLVVFDFEVKHTNNMKTSMAFCVGGGLATNGNHSAWRGLTPANGVNGGWRPAVGHRFQAQFQVKPLRADCLFMQWWSGSGGARSGYYFGGNGTREAYECKWYQWSCTIYWN